MYEDVCCCIEICLSLAAFCAKKKLIIGYRIHEFLNSFCKAKALFFCNYYVSHSSQEIMGFSLIAVFIQESGEDLFLAKQQRNIINVKMRLADFS